MVSLFTETNRLHPLSKQETNLYFNVSYYCTKGGLPTLD